jgi:hypothetical protein
MYNWTNDSERIAVMGLIHRETVQAHGVKIEMLEGQLAQAKDQIALLKMYLKELSEGATFALPPELGV